jgi:MFS family permease
VHGIGHFRTPADLIQASKLVSIAKYVTITSFPRRVTAAGLSRGFVAMRHPNYRRFWFGQIGSLVGTWMQSVALPWLVLDLGGSPLQLGLVIAFLFGPSMVIAPLGGVLADRLDRRRTLIVANAIAMAQASVLFVLAFTGVIEIWHVFALAIVAGTASAIEMPVRQSFVAELVPREDLVNAIALNSTSFNLSRVVGPAVAGLTIAAFGVWANFAINALSYVSVLVGLALVDPSGLHATPRPIAFPSIRSSLAEGLRYARSTPTVLWPLVLLGGTAALAMNFQTLLPLFTRNALGMDSGGYGAIYAAMGFGSLIGSLALAFTSHRRPLVSLIISGGAVFLVLAFLLGFVREPLFAFALVIGIGLASMLMVNTINVTIQNSVPDALRGRVMSLYVTVFAGSAPIGGLFAGAVAQAFGAPFALSLGAALGTGVLALAAWKLRGVTARALEATRSEPRRETLSAA